MQDFFSTYAHLYICVSKTDDWIYEANVFEGIIFHSRRLQKSMSARQLNIKNK